jgi:hypothetical protein
MLMIVGCSSDNVQETSSTPANTSTNEAVFDPATGDIPLPNVLASAMAADPLTQYSAPGSAKTVAKAVGARPANTPMSPPEALAYVSKYEMGGLPAVDGVNAPIYIHFNSPLDPATVTSANIKVFQNSNIATDMNTDGAENHPLAFADVTGMFTIKYTAGGTDLFLFPNFPMLPATKYMYVVTNRVKDLATGKSVNNSFYFNALKSLTPLVGPLAGLEQIRADKTSGSSILFRGYCSAMNDLIANSATTTITSRDNIALMGRFVTTGAGFVPKVATGASTDFATENLMPVETALRAFAAGSTLSSLGGLSGKTWTNSFTVSTTFDKNGTNPTPDTYWTMVMGATTAAPTTVSSVSLGTINSADISIDPVVARATANSGTMNLTGVTGAYNPAAGVLQPFRDSTTHALAGYYHTNRPVPVVLIKPTTSNGKVVIFQHGITGQKEQVVAVAGSLTAAGYTVVAIDLPLHGELAVPTHTTGDVWSQDFLAVGAPLATRSNIQQAALNLHRLELTMRTGGFAAVAGAAGAGLTADIKFVSLSLGSIVGAYYLAGNTTLSTTGYPYTQATLNSDMKGFLSVPGGRLAYLLQNSPAFGSSINKGLAAVGIAEGTPTYHKFMQVSQSIVDPVDPATMTTPLAPGLPSRLSGRIAVQEAVGDQVIPNDNARYFGNALGGRGVLGAAGAAVAPGFNQLSYIVASRIPSSFMYTLTGGVPAPKTVSAATNGSRAATPAEGYFQFDQTGINHGFLIDPRASVANTTLAQSQMVQFLLYGGIVDPTPSAPAKQVSAAPITGVKYDVSLPPLLKIFGY